MVSCRQCFYSRQPIRKYTILLLICYSWFGRIVELTRRNIIRVLYTIIIIRMIRIFHEKKKNSDLVNHKPFHHWLKHSTKKKNLEIEY